MTEPHASPNGDSKPLDDLYAAGDRLYKELHGKAWFVGVEFDSEKMVLNVEVHDLEAALVWFGGRDWYGWVVTMKAGKAMARKGNA